MNDPTIIFEDDVFLVINKPSGMTVNISDTTKGDRTVQDWVEEYLKIRLGFWTSLQAEPSVRGQNDVILGSEATPESNFISVFLSRAGIVHRLDKETSGILLVAKTPEAFAALQAQFKERRVKKTYIALVHGKMEQETGEISVPVGRLPWNRKQFGVVAGGREALTRFKRIKNYPIRQAQGKELRIKNDNEMLTLLELYPETGRTHQIRVHLKHIGHPVFGDFLYAGRKTARNDRKLLPRVFLHAAGITFFHPTTGEEVSFTAPLTEELSSFLLSFP